MSAIRNLRENGIFSPCEKHMFIKTVDPPCLLLEISYSYAGMIFVPSVKGISHSPKEFTSAEDMANGASVLLRTVLEIDGGGGGL